MATTAASAPASFPGSDWPMEDRLAAMIAAVLYTSDHIDLVRYTTPPDPGLPDKQRPKAIADERLRAINELNTAKGTLSATYPAQQFVYHTPAQTLVEGKPETIVEAHDISELDFDTVAIVLSGAVLCVACNYKIRSTAVSGTGRNTTHKITYKGFGQVSQTAIGNVKAILMGELPKVATVKEAFLIGPAEQPANDKENAAPHAEMQILSYLTKQNALPKDGKLYFGVSKPCCSQCAGVLDKAGYKYREKASLTVKNWLPPEQIEIKTVYNERFD